MVGVPGEAEEALGDGKGVFEADVLDMTFKSTERTLNHFREEI